MIRRDATRLAWRPSRTAGPPARSSHWEHPDAVLFNGAGIAALFLLPLAVGGRHAGGYAVLSIAAIVACLAWLVRMLRVDEPRWTVGVGEAFFVAGLLIAGLQLVTLSPAVIDTVSPRLHALLPAYSGGPWSIGTWRTLSLTPGESSVGLSILLAQGILALVVYQFARSTVAIERLLVIVVAAAAIVALHGLIQFVGHEGKTFDVAAVSFHEQGGIVKSTFRNRNDFAGFLAITAGPTLWFAFRRREHERPRSARQSRRPLSRSAPETDAVRITFGLGILGIISFAILASSARGGSIALGVAAMVACGMLVHSGHLRPRMGLAILAAAAILAVALEIHGMEQVANRMETLLDDNHQETVFGRGEVWHAAWKAILDFPLTGTGIGSHGDMSRIMMPPTGATHYVHAESSYLNLAVEAGLPGLGVAVLATLVALVATATVFCSGSAREKSVAAAIAAGLVAGAVNGIGHFNWYAPAITTLMMVLGICGIRMAVPYAAWLPHARMPVPRSLAVLTVSAAMLILGLIATRQITAAVVEPTWDEAVREARSHGRDGRSLLEAEAAVAIEAANYPTIPAEPPDESLVQDVKAITERRQSLLGRLDARIKLLEKVVAARPEHPRAWAELAIVRCERFDMARSVAGESIMLDDIRQTAIHGGFPDRAAFDGWLQSVAGDALDDLNLAYDSAKRAVMNAPCAGDAWCVLGRLSFLESLDPELPRRCIEQALRVQPHEGIVLFAAAWQATLDGAGDLATARWQKLFALSPSLRNTVANLLLPRITADEAVAMLAPDLAGLRAIDTAWSRQASPEQMRPVREQRLAAVLVAADREKQPALQAALLREAAAVQRAIGDHEGMMATLQAAIVAQPSDYHTHLAVADLALQRGDYEVAARELDWCRLRRPDSEAIRSRRERLARLREGRVKTVSHQE